jgi:serine/threonine protein phosphatase PrpC
VLITSFALSDRGSRRRNEDAHADAHLMAGRCVIVADGAGGHHGGDVASRLVIDTALLHLAAAPRLDGATLVSAIDAAGSAVRERQAAERELAQMSATVALLCIDAGTDVAWWAHLGDSRILFFRRGLARQLTRDHSVLQSFADAGLLSGEAALERLDRTALYAAVGAEGDTRPPAGDPMSLQDGDAFLLCTDGVWDSVDVDEIAALLGFSTTVQEWVEGIGGAVRAAAKPNQDNFTAVGVWVGSPEQITVTRY